MPIQDEEKSAIIGHSDPAGILFMQRGCEKKETYTCIEGMVVTLYNQPLSTGYNANRQHAWVLTALCLVSCSCARASNSPLDRFPDGSGCSVLALLYLLLSNQQALYKRRRRRRVEHVLLLVWRAYQELGSLPVQRVISCKAGQCVQVCKYLSWACVCV